MYCNKETEFTDFSTAMWVQKLKSFSINFHSALFIDHTKKETWAKYSFAFLRFHEKNWNKKAATFKRRRKLRTEWEWLNDCYDGKIAKNNIFVSIL